MCSRSTAILAGIAAYAYRMYRMLGISRWSVNLVPIADAMQPARLQSMTPGVRSSAHQIVAPSPIAKSCYFYKKIISMHRNSMSVVDVVFNLSPSVSLCLSCQASSNLLIPPSRRMNFSFHHRRSNLIVNLFIFVWTSASGKSASMHLRSWALVCMCVCVFAFAASER